MNILICVVICFVSVCITIFLNKRTAAKLYQSLVLEADKPESPYSVSREYGPGGWGYCITKNGEVMYSDNKSRVFRKIEDAVTEINKLEGVQGYKKTRV